MKGTGAREVVEWLRVLTALLEDPSSVPSSHIGWLTATCNSCSRGSSAIFWPLRSLHMPVHAHTYTHIHINENESKENSERPPSLLAFWKDLSPKVLVACPSLCSPKETESGYL